jgi:hypothetical protein
MHACTHAHMNDAYTEKERKKERKEQTNNFMQRAGHCSIN